MKFTSDQFEPFLGVSCLPLRFLVRPETRSANRENFPDHSDAAIFFRWMDLFWTPREPEVLALLNDDEKRILSEFDAGFASLTWQLVQWDPPMAEVSDEELRTLL